MVQLPYESKALWHTMWFSQQDEEKGKSFCGISDYRYLDYIS